MGLLLELLRTILPRWSQKTSPYLPLHPVPTEVALEKRYGNHPREGPSSYGFLHHTPPTMGQHQTHFPSKERCLELRVNGGIHRELTYGQRGSSLSEIVA